VITIWACVPADAPYVPSVQAIEESVRFGGFNITGNVFQADQHWWHEIVGWEHPSWDATDQCVELATNGIHAVVMNRETENA
jgi:hypothetical protein